MNRALSFVAGLALAFGAAATLLPAQQRAPDPVGRLCVNGRPAPRAAGVTYGGLPPRLGYQRDHRQPLCLGGADDAANVRYQPLDEALAKDKDEQRACEAYCRGEISLEAARLWLAGRWDR